MKLSSASLLMIVSVVSFGAIAASGQTAAVDRGQVDPETPISITIALSLPNLGDAERLQQAIYTPGDPQFHHFLTAEEFVARFAPSSAEIAKITTALARYGLTAEKTTATTLKVTGLPAQFERAFSINLHRFDVDAHDSSPGYSYHAPMSRPIIPAEIAPAVSAILGLDSRPVAHPHIRRISSVAGVGLPSQPNADTGDAFGSLTVLDFADHYDVNP